MIDPRQRYDDLEAIIRLALGANQAGIWTAMPAIVQSTDVGSSGQITATVQLAIAGAVEKQDGTAVPANYPSLHDVPVLWQRGGGCTLTFPIAAGDEGLLIFASRCIDGWWQNGNINNRPAEPRMHDMSDGFLIVGPFSQATKISNVSTTTAQLRSNDGTTYVELNPTGQIVHVKAPGGLTIDANVTINGNMQLNGNETASGTITGTTDVVGGSASVSLKGHHHTGVQTGSSNTGGPV